MGGVAVGLGFARRSELIVPCRRFVSVVVVGFGWRRGVRYLFRKGASFVARVGWFGRRLVRRCRYRKAVEFGFGCCSC